MWSVIDYDDDNPLATIADALQYGTCQINTMSSGYFKRVLQPRFAIAAYSGVFTSFALSPQNTWVDVASPNVKYFGLKFIGAPTTALVQHVRLGFQVILQCRNNR